MIIVTGGAGFIGSALVWALNERGRSDIIIVDEVDHDEKEMNIGHLQYERLIGIRDFRDELKAGDWDDNVEAILHMGACSDTTETDWDYLLENNVEYTQDVIRHCTDRGIRLIYASSAAVYGDGEQGFSDNHDLFGEFTPLNLYAKSKLEVDVWARDANYLDEVVGLRYFNVYGPNEAHKQHMRSVIAKKFSEVRDDGKISLFKSYNDDFQDGEQERDFIYIKDAIEATLFFLDNKDANGIYNVGTGHAGTWNDVARGMFAALDKEENIEYVEMSEELQGKYQYRTEADISKLREVGFNHEFMRLEDAVGDYVKSYLVKDRRLGE